MSKKVFISYSRKDTLAIAEFKTIKKFRDFEIVIDDEEIPFNQLWKENIKNKINDSDAAIFFISKNALKKDSPIRSLEIPLISKRLRDPKDDFNFFPIFLEDVEKELNSYTFTTLKDSKEVKFLDFFQIYEIEKQNTLENLSMLKRKRFFKNINANISQVLKGGTLSPGQDLITKLSRIQKVRWAFGVLSLVVGLSWFTTTDAYARILIAAYEQRIESGGINAESAAVKFLADQLNTVENLDSLTSDEALLKSVGEIADLSTNIVVDTETQNIELSSTQDSTTITIGSTTTTIGSTTTTIGSTTTTIGSTTTTIGSTTTTLGSTTTTLGSTTTTINDTIAPTFTKTLTAANVTSGKVDISWEASDNIQISYYVLREGSYIIYQGTNNFKEVEGLTSSKSYTFSVDAYDKAGNFSTSEVTFITLDTTTTTTIPTTTTTTIPTTTTTTTIPTTTTTLYQNKLPAITALDFGWSPFPEYSIYNDGNNLAIYPKYTIKSMDLTVQERPTFKFIVNEDTNHILDCNPNQFRGSHSTTSKNFEGLQECSLDISNYNYADTLKLYEISLKTSLGEESVVYKFDLSVENNDFSDSLNYTNYLQATSHNYFVSLNPINLGE